MHGYNTIDVAIDSLSQVYLYGRTELALQALIIVQMLNISLCFLLGTC